MWEFPGGKLEAGEAALGALARELKEVLDIEIIEAEAFMQVRHNYDDKRVLLDFWRVFAFSGVPTGLEGQAIQWVSVEELDQLQFPQANQSVVTALMRSALHAASV